MEMEKAYLIAIAALAASFIAGGFIFMFRSGRTGFFSAGLEGGLAGNGQWIEVKPRLENPGAAPDSSAGESSDFAAASAQNISQLPPAAVSKSASKAENYTVAWCDFSTAQSPVREVVINEIAWMGSPASYSDEWIELKNISGAPIDLSGWQLQNKNKKIKIIFAAGAVLAPGDFYLLERTDDGSASQAPADVIYSGSIGNSNESLYLFSSRCLLQDSAATLGKWPAGDNSTKQTMARSASLEWKTSRFAGGTPKKNNDF